MTMLTNPLYLQYRDFEDHRRLSDVIRYVEAFKDLTPDHQKRRINYVIKQINKLKTPSVVDELKKQLYESYTIPIKH